MAHGKRKTEPIKITPRLKIKMRKVREALNKPTSDSSVVVKVRNMMPGAFRRFSHGWINLLLSLRNCTLVMFYRRKPIMLTLPYEKRSARQRHVSLANTTEEEKHQMGIELVRDILAHYIYE